MVSLSKRTRNKEKQKYTVIGNHDKFLNRINRTLYYGKLPITERLSLPVTEIASEIFSQKNFNKAKELSKKKFPIKLQLESSVAAEISREACVSPCAFIMALLYLDRLKKSNPGFIRQTPSSKLFLISLMISSKFLNDDGEENEVIADEWAKSGNISVKELNNLEKEFLSAIDWDVFVSDETFWRKFKQLETVVALRQGNNRGYTYTYTDMQNLLDCLEIAKTFQTLYSTTVLMMASYTASILTIFGSFLIASHVPGTSLNAQRVMNIEEKWNQMSMDDSIKENTNVNYLDSEEIDLTEKAILDQINNFKNETLTITDENDNNKIDTKSNIKFRKKMSINDEQIKSVITTSLILATIKTKCVEELANQMRMIRKTKIFDDKNKKLDLLPLVYEWKYNSSNDLLDQDVEKRLSSSFELNAKCSECNSNLLKISNRMNFYSRNEYYIEYTKWYEKLDYWLLKLIKWLKIYSVPEKSILINLNEYFEKEKFQNLNRILFLKIFE